jgi:hypothetical protein
MLSGGTKSEWRAAGGEARNLCGEGVRLPDTPHISTVDGLMSILSMSYSNESIGATADTVDSELDESPARPHPGFGAEVSRASTIFGS